MVVLGALISIAFPYRWIAQLGGSPGGYAMTYVPLIFLGLAIAVQSFRLYGGIIAGAGLLLACLGDVQVFFFSVLSIPVFCLIVAFADESPFYRFLPRCRGWSLSLSPLLLFLACAFGYRFLLQPFIRTSVMSGGRSEAEVNINTPDFSGLFGGPDGVNNWHIYIGPSIAVFLFVGFICQLMGTKMIDLPVDRMHSRRRLATFLLVSFWCMFVICLALAFQGPLEGVLYRISRVVIPPYSYIRQPVRIFCLMPTLLGLACVLSLDTLGKSSHFALWKNYLVAGVGAVIMTDYALQVRATVCVLDREQAAYRAVVDDATARGEIPRAIAVPLWPGDSDWSSIYQYYSTLYRLRLVNGYSPVVTEEYFKNVFRQFESLNQGFITAEQVRNLAEMDVGYVLVHENAFPEKVSPFPVRVTIDRLMDHPSFVLLARAGEVWAFRVLPDAADSGFLQEPKDKVYCLAADRIVDLAQCVTDKAMVVHDSQGARGKFVCLSEEGQTIRTRAWKYAGERGLQWNIRVRGEGTLLVGTEQDEIPLSAAYCEIKSVDWTWIGVPVKIDGGFGRMVLELELERGRLELDLAYLGIPVVHLGVGDELAVRPADLFHAGYSTPDSGAVHFHRARDPDLAILYGPHLPLAPGYYQFIMEIESDAIRGVPLGTLRASSKWVAARPLAIMEAGTTVWDLRVTEDLPMRFEFVYSRKADLSINSILLRRLESPSGQNSLGSPD